MRTARRTMRPPRMPPRRVRRPTVPPPTRRGPMPPLSGGSGRRRGRATRGSPRTPPPISVIAARTAGKRAFICLLLSRLPCTGNAPHPATRLRLCQLITVLNEQAATAHVAPRARRPHSGGNDDRSSRVGARLCGSGSGGCSTGPGRRPWRARRSSSSTARIAEVGPRRRGSAAPRTPDAGSPGTTALPG